MPGSTFRKLVLCGLLTFLAAVPAKAQNKAVVSNITFIGDFSDIPLGTARPMQVNIQSNIGVYTGEAYLSNDDSFSTHIGFSTNPGGPFTALLAVPFSLQNGNGTTPIIYFKAMSPAASTYIRVGTAVGSGSSPYFSVTTTAPPPPPPNQPSASIVASYDKLSVGSVAPLRLQVSGLSGNFGGFVDTYQVTTDIPGAMLFSLSPNGPFMPAASVPIQINGSGEGQSADFYVKGHTANLGLSAPLATSRVVGCPTALPCLIPRILRVVNINVAWLGNASPTNEGIDHDPRVSGKRIFVGKLTADDTAAADRRKVVVHVNLSERIAGVRVRFRWFDVDDPTSNVPPIDPNGSAGDDNRGSGAFLSSTTAITDENGFAKVTLSVSRQPGDNFRVAASAEAPSSGTHNFLAGVTVSGTDLVNGSQLGEETTIATGAAVATEMLTVWRRLHIERDAMEPVSGNSVTGTVTQVTTPYGDGSLLKVGSPLEKGRFKHGRIGLQVPGTAGLAFSYEVLGNSATQVLTSTPVPSQVTGWRFTLFDDDDFNDNDTIPNGDEGEKLPWPDMSVLADSDDPAKNKLAAAFIRPTYDLAKGFAPFEPNATPDPSHPLGTDLSELYAFDNQASEADPEFWTIYVLSAYQHKPDSDRDPDEEQGLKFADVDASGKGFALFHEQHAEYLRLVSQGEEEPEPFFELANIVAHYVASLFGGVDEDGGFMGLDDTEYSAVTLHKIRSTNHPCAPGVSGRRKT